MPEAVKEPVPETNEPVEKIPCKEVKTVDPTEKINADPENKEITTEPISVEDSKDIKKDVEKSESQKEEGVNEPKECVREDCAGDSETATSESNAEVDECKKSEEIKDEGSLPPNENEATNGKEAKHSDASNGDVAKDGVGEIAVNGGEKDSTPVQLDEPMTVENTASTEANENIKAGEELEGKVNDDSSGDKKETEEPVKVSAEQKPVDTSDNSLKPSSESSEKKDEKLPEATKPDDNAMDIADEVQPADDKPEASSAVVKQSDDSLSKSSKPETTDMKPSDNKPEEGEKKPMNENTEESMEVDSVPASEENPKGDSETTKPSSDESSDKALSDSEFKKPEVSPSAESDKVSTSEVEKKETNVDTQSMEVNESANEATAKEQPADQVNKEPPTSTNEEPPASSNEEPPASANEEPPTSANEEPPASANEEPPASANKEPPASSKEEPPASTKEEPATSAPSESSSADNKVKESKPTESSDSEAKVETEKKNDSDPSSKMEDATADSSESGGSVEPGRSEEINPEEVEQVKTSLREAKALLKTSEFFQAADILGKTCEIASRLYGEFGVENAELYYMYGCAMLECAKNENPVLGEAVKDKEEDDDEENDEEGGEEKKDEEMDGEEKMEVENEVSDETEANKEETESEEKESGKEETDQAEESTAAKDDEEDEDSSLKVAWEMFELSKIIFEKTGDSIKLAETYIKLGEVGMESGHEQAIEDMKKALELRMKCAAENDRLLAETHFNIGLAYATFQLFDEAIAAFQVSKTTIENKIEKLKTEDNDSSKTEAKELSDLLPDLDDKIKDMEDSKVAKEKGELIPVPTNGQSVSFDSASSSKTASNIAHLVKRKRKLEDVASDLLPSTKQPCTEKEEPESTKKDSEN